MKNWFLTRYHADSTKMPPDLSGDGTVINLDRFIFLALNKIKGVYAFLSLCAPLMDLSREDFKNVVLLLPHPP